MNHDLDLKNFETSDITVSVEKTNSDSYLKSFEQHITNSTVRPENFNTLKNQFDIVLNNDDYFFNTGIVSYEDTQVGKKMTDFNTIFHITILIQCLVKTFLMELCLFHRLVKTI